MHSRHDRSRRKVPGNCGSHFAGLSGAFWPHRVAEPDQLHCKIECNDKFDKSYLNLDQIGQYMSAVACMLVDSMTVDRLHGSIYR